MKKKDINNNYKHDDHLIQDLFNDFTPEKAPDSIKQNVMNRVFHDWVESPVNHQPFINKSNRWWVIGISAAVLAIAFLVDASVFQGALSDLGLNTETIDFSAMNKSLEQTLSLAAKIPSFVYFVGFGILFLLGLDKILNRMANL